MAGEGAHHLNRVDYLILNPVHVASQLDLLTYLVNSGLFQYIWKGDQLHVLQRVREERYPRELALADWESYCNSHQLKVRRIELCEVVESRGNQAGCATPVDHAVEPVDATTIDVDLASIFPGVGQRSVYLHASIDSLSTQQVEISLGMDDGMVIWLNDQSVVEFPGPQAFMPNQYKVPVQLLEGENRFCFRVDDVGGAWRIQARFFPLLQQ